VDRKRWCKPALTVLTRTNPEENVLAACKNPSMKGPGTSNCKVPNNPDCATMGAS